MIPPHMTPAEFRALERSTIRALAEEGRAVDTACRVFLDNVFPNASPEQLEMLRWAFFMGAHESFALTMGGMDDDGSDEPSPDDYVIHQRIMDEIITFAQRTVGGGA